MIKIRLAKKEHMKAILKLTMEVHNFHIGLYPKKYHAPRKKDLLTGIKSLFDNPDCRYFIATENHKIIGYALVRLISKPGNIMQKPQRHADIDQMGITKNKCNKGIGTSLMMRIKKYVYGKGYKTLTLNVMDKNIIAQEAYKSYGFEFVNHKMELSLKAQYQNNKITET